jgi:hypothetical protein
MACEYALSYCECKQFTRHAKLAHMVTPMLSPTRPGGDERGAALSPMSRNATGVAHGQRDQDRGSRARGLMEGASATSPYSVKEGSLVPACVRQWCEG